MSRDAEQRALLGHEPEPRRGMTRSASAYHRPPASRHDAERGAGDGYPVRIPAYITPRRAQSERRISAARTDAGPRMPRRSAKRGARSARSLHGRTSPPPRSPASVGSPVSGLFNRRLSASMGHIRQRDSGGRDASPTSDGEALTILAGPTSADAAAMASLLSLELEAGEMGVTTPVAGRSGTAGGAGSSSVRSGRRPRSSLPREIPTPPVDALPSGTAAGAGDYNTMSPVMDTESRGTSIYRGARGAARRYNSRDSRATRATQSVVGRVPPTEEDTEDISMLDASESDEDGKGTETGVGVIDCRPGARSETSTAYSTRQERLGATTPPAGAGAGTGAGARPRHGALQRDGRRSARGSTRGGDIMLEAGRMLIRRAFEEGDQKAAYTTYDDMHDSFLSRHNHVFGPRIKLALCVTMFNEEEEELRRTMEGIAVNLEQLEVDPSEVLVCLVADGRINVSESLIEYADMLHILNADDLAQAAEDIDAGRCAPKVHIFEHPRVQVLPHGGAQNLLQVMFCIKEDNAGKLNSHRWFFDALCKSVVPDIIYLIDAGTQPKTGSLEALRRNFEDFPLLGGCCGELKVYQPRCFQLVNSAQQFEYKMSHILDKAMESMFGFVSVLPGAFSAYRYTAIQGRPLDKYFHCEHNSVSNWFMSNMYLAEDRILGFEVLVKADCKWHLSYVYDSVADTDVPESIVGLVRQRRRWLNGAFFTLLYFMANWWRLMFCTKHNIIRKFGFLVQFLYMVVNLVVYWFTLGNMFLSFYIVMAITLESQMLFQCLQIVYVGILMVQFVFALGTQAKDFPSVYVIFSIIHGITMVLVVTSLFWYLIDHVSTEFIFLLGTAGVGSYAVVTVLYGESCFVLSNCIQYVFMVPTFMSVIMVFSFCNIHDVSWGTRAAKSSGAAAKEDAEVVKRRQQQRDAAERALRRARGVLVACWLSSNWLFAAAFVQFNITQQYAMGVVLAYGGMLGFRLAGSVCYRVHMLVYHCCRRKPTRRRVYASPHGSVASGLGSGRLSRGGSVRTVNVISRVAVTPRSAISAAQPAREIELGER